MGKTRRPNGLFLDLAAFMRNAKGFMRNAKTFQNDVWPFLSKSRRAKVHA